MCIVLDKVYNHTVWKWTLVRDFKHVFRIYRFGHHFTQNHAISHGHTSTWSPGRSARFFAKPRGISWFQTPTIYFRVIYPDKKVKWNLCGDITCTTLHDVPNRVVLTGAKTIGTCDFPRNKENHADNVWFFGPNASKTMESSNSRERSAFTSQNI